MNNLEDNNREYKNLKDIFDKLASYALLKMRDKLQEEADKIIWSIIDDKKKKKERHLTKDDIKKIDRVIRRKLGTIALSGLLAVGAVKTYDSILYSGVNIDYNEKGDDEIDLFHFNGDSNGKVHIKTFESNIPGISNQTDFFVDDVHLTAQEVQLYAQKREEEKKFKEAIENILNTTLEKYKDEIESDLDFSPDSEYTSENLAIKKFLKNLYAYSYNKTHIGEKLSPENVWLISRARETYESSTPYVIFDHATNR